MRIAIGSENKTKIEAVRTAVVLSADVRDTVNFFAYAVASGVSEQPMGLEETHLGARNRAVAALAADSAADIALGVEGGIIQVGEDYLDFGFVYALGRSGLHGLGMSQGHTISPELMAHVERGVDLSQAVQAVHGTDTVADRDCSVVMTDGILDGTTLYHQPARLALRDYFSKSLVS